MYLCIREVDIGAADIHMHFYSWATLLIVLN